MAPHQISDRNCAADCSLDSLNGGDLVHDINSKLDSDDRDIEKANNIMGRSHPEQDHISVDSLSCWRRSRFWLINHHSQLVANNSNDCPAPEKKSKIIIIIKNAVSSQEVLDLLVGSGKVLLGLGQVCSHTGDEAGSERRRKS